MFEIHRNIEIQYIITRSDIFPKPLQDNLNLDNKKGDDSEPSTCKHS